MDCKHFDAPETDIFLNPDEIDYFVNTDFIYLEKGKQTARQYQS